MFSINPHFPVLVKFSKPSNLFWDLSLTSQTIAPCLKTGEVAIRKYVNSAKVVELKSFKSIKEMLSKVV